MIMPRNQMFFAAGFIIILLAGMAVWYWSGKREQASDEKIPKQTQEQEGVGARLFEQAQNPIKEQMPNTNPFSATTNPFQENPNPFNATYKNPFQ